MISQTNVNRISRNFKDVFGVDPQLSDVDKNQGTAKTIKAVVNKVVTMKDLQDLQKGVPLEPTIRRSGAGVCITFHHS